MTAKVARPSLRLAGRAVTADDVLAALADAILVVDADGRVGDANPAAEAFFALARSQLVGQPLATVVGGDGPLMSLVAACHADATNHTAYDLPVARGRHRPLEVDVQVAALASGAVAVVLRATSLAQRLGEQMQHHATGRSLAGLAAVLAHEVRNPLSGIRGAAQLLERDAPVGSRDLTRLIVGEVDRIRLLLDRMDSLAEGRAVELGPVNIHEVLEHVRRLAVAGFASGLGFVDRYDPSLPPVQGDRDLLVQAFLNLVKNAAEAAPAGQGTITLATAFQSGLRVSAPTGGARLGLPIVASIIDDGPGIPDDLRPHLFEPFASGRRGGRGLGLAIVARIVADLGGAIEVESRRGHTQFNVFLAVAS
ncbi:MAG: PAS domain-containing protein [Alphaproteobacteria bacterium]|nr:PAS domain-containing protein [Alphaproteobacteria bacterium]